MGSERRRVKGDERRQEGENEREMSTLLSPVKEARGESLEPGDSNLSVEGWERGRG